MLKSKMAPVINLLFFVFLLYTQAGTQESRSFFPVLQSGKWGYIDKTGTVVIKPQFDYAYNFYEGLARVKIGKRSGFIDRTGKFVVGARSIAQADSLKAWLK